MKTALNVAIVAMLLVVTSGRCFGMWDVENVSKERAKELGVEVRAQAAGANHVRVEIEFPTTGAFKNFAKGTSSSDPSRVELRIGKGDSLLLAAALREDRSKAGRIVVSFTLSRDQLEKASVWVMVAEGLGGSAYELKVGEFVEGEKGR